MQEEEPKKLSKGARYRLNKRNRNGVITPAFVTQYIKPTYCYYPQPPIGPRTITQALDSYSPVEPVYVYDYQTYYPMNSPMDSEDESMPFHVCIDVGCHRDHCGFCYGTRKLWSECRRCETRICKDCRYMGCPNDCYSHSEDSDDDMKF